MNKYFLSAILFFLQLAQPANGDVDLVTIPSRAYLQLTVYNSEDLTLVRERRLLTFKKGVNKIQFSWSGALVDPTSVNFFPLEYIEKVKLIHTNYPPGRHDLCQWAIESDIEGPCLVEISYFTSGITWQADYLCIANEDETAMTLKGRMKVVNLSGEEYENAQTRIVVGQINLVEKIADLARRGYPMPCAADAFGEEIADYECEFLGRRSCSKESKKSFDFKKPKKIKKEGLSEYFIFTIEGVETVMNGWSKRLKAVCVDEVPLIVLYKLSDKEDGRLKKYYKFFNKRIERDSEKGQLGECPLPNGGVRAFRDNGKDGLVYIGASQTKYIPINEKVELDMGVDPDVTAERILKNYKRTNIVLNSKGTVIAFKEHYYYQTTINNTTQRAIQVEMERCFSGDFELHDLRGAESFEKKDEATAAYYIDLGPSEKRTVTYRVEVFHPERK